TDLLTLVEEKTTQFEDAYWQALAQREVAQRPSADHNISKQIQIETQQARLPRKQEERRKLKEIELPREIENCIRAIINQVTLGENDKGTPEHTSTPTSSVGLAEQSTLAGPRLTEAAKESLPDEDQPVPNVIRVQQWTNKVE